MAPAPKDGSSSRFHPYDKKAKGKHIKPRPQPGPSVNELKRRIRDVKRVLNHKDLPTDARIVQERALAGYEKDLKEELERRKRSEMIKRYHFVRFLDRKSATKELKRLQRRQREMMNESNPPAKPEALARIAEKIREAEINVNYTIYYPLTEKYISLYPHDKKKQQREQQEKKDSTDSGGGGGDVSDDDNDLNGLLLAPHTDPSSKPPMWRVVEQCMKENTLDLLREGKLNIGVDGKPKNPTPDDNSTAAAEHNANGGKSGSSKQKTTATMNRKDKKDKESDPSRRNRDDDDDESDGGFFE